MEGNSENDWRGAERKRNFCDLQLHIACQSFVTVEGLGLIVVGVGPALKYMQEGS